MKKASKLFKSQHHQQSKQSNIINGHSSFSTAAASALSLSPVAEDDEDFHRAFYSPANNNELDRRIGDSWHRDAVSSGSYSSHPHEIDRDLTSEELKSYNHSGSMDHDGRSRRRRRMKQQEDQLDKWNKYKEGTASSKRGHKKHSSDEACTAAYTDDGTDNADDVRHRRQLSSPPAPPFSKDRGGNSGKYHHSTSEDYNPEACYTSEQKRTIDNYVQSVIAHASSPEYVTPLPRLSSSGLYSDDDMMAHETQSGFFSDDETKNITTNDSHSSQLLPLPGFGEVDLLQRAIERRALLHDRIQKMEEASADLFSREKKESDTARHDKNKNDNIHKSRRRTSVEENEEDARMNEISERIKAEALEFLSSSYDNGSNSNSDNLTEEASCTTRDGSYEGEDPPEEIGPCSSGDNVYRQRMQRQQQQSPATSNDTTTSTVDQGPTSAQLARYGNMVRLGIPDLAILRSMERDGIDPSLRGNGILESLKHKYRVEDENIGGVGHAPSDELDVKDENDDDVTKKKQTTATAVGKPDNITPVRNRKDSLPPLKDDPNYNKYFKMLKAKVPLSWVKRVLEVDGKDARVLDLDPDRPLHEQIAGAGVDEYGNIDWSKVVIFRCGSDKSVDSSGDELMGKKGHTRRLSGHAAPSAIHLETAASVKAELAIMTAKAAGRSSVGSSSRPSPRQSSLSRESDSSMDAKEVKKSIVPNPADISSAAAAASNARLSRLKAMTTPDRTSIRKQRVDEIRRRPPPPPPRTPKSLPPPSPSANSATSNEPVKSSRRQTYEHLPLKDDPRFSKYFQMIRSRVPRSWVERVIEVDDRDPAILDLDPNKPLAAQVDDEDSKSLIKTVATETDGSLDDSVHSSALDSSGVSRGGDVYQIKDDSALSPTEEEEDAGEEIPPPISQIVNPIDDERSVASSITNFRDVPGSQAEQSNAVLDRISAFLDKIEARTRSTEVTQHAGEPSENKQSRRLSQPEDIESKLTSLLERFDSREAKQQTSEHPATQGGVDEEKQFMEENQSDITKLTSLLASKLGQQTAIAETVASNDQTDLSKLSTLLTEVLSRMDDTSSSDQIETSELSPSPSKLSKNAALEALFAKRAALSEEKEPPILREDPEYQKYFKMQKLGMPRPVIEQALERDGKDVSILDLDPGRPLAEQQQEKSRPKPNKNAALEALFANRAAAMQQPEKRDVPLKNDPEYQKYFKMLKVGMPRDAVVQALERDGKSASILDLDPEKPYASQTASGSADEARDEVEEKKPDVSLKDDPDYAKFFKMLKMGIPLGAVEQALQKEGKDRAVASMDPNKSYSSQIQETKISEDKKAEPVALKDDPEYSKFFKMLKMGIPLPAVKQALVKEGKDPNIIDMDPDKPLAKVVALKADPEYSKFFKMLKMGIPLPAVKQALVKEGKDPGIIDMDPEKPPNQQQSKPLKEAKKSEKAYPGSKVARKRLHWNKIDESKLNEKSFWNQAKGEHASLQLVGLDIDNEEFASLFTSQVNKSAAPKKEIAVDAKKSPGKQKVQLIDGRRRMNGSILLTKFKVDYKLLAKQVDSMEFVKAEGNELRGMMQLLPTKDESLALRSYLPPADAPQSEIDEAIDKLGECEQYMAVMLDVPDAKEKFECMLYRAEFEHQVDSIRDGTKLLIDACDSVQNSERFKKLLMYALKLGNALNTDASGAEATAITLDSLLKLAEAKAFDRQTSVLHYLVSIVSKNDEDVLKLSEDFVPVKAAERVAVDMLSQQLKELTKGIDLIKEMAKKYAPQNENVDCEIDEEIPEDELLSATAMGKFSLSAESKITSLTKEFAEAKVNFADLLEFFGEDPNLTPEAFFCTINTFVSMFDQTYKELKRKEEAKERKKRIEEKKKIREEAAKQGKAKS